MAATFVCDISVEKDGGLYISRPVTPLGKMWCSMYHNQPLRSFFIPQSLIKDYKLAIEKQGLTVEVED